MEMNYVFMTDRDSDLPYHLKAEYDIPVVYMPYALTVRNTSMIWARHWTIKAISMPCATEPIPSPPP